MKRFWRYIFAHQAVAIDTDIRWSDLVEEIARSIPALEENPHRYFQAKRGTVVYKAHSDVIEISIHWPISRLFGLIPGSWRLSVKRSQDDRILPIGGFESFEIHKWIFMPVIFAGAFGTALISWSWLFGGFFADRPDIAGVTFSWLFLPVFILFVGLLFRWRRWCAQPDLQKIIKFLEGLGVTATVRKRR